MFRLMGMQKVTEQITEQEHKRINATANSKGYYHSRKQHGNGNAIGKSTDPLSPNRGSVPHSQRRSKRSTQTPMRGGQVCTEQHPSEYRTARHTCVLLPQTWHRQLASYRLQRLMDACHVPLLRQQHPTRHACCQLRAFWSPPLH